MTSYLLNISILLKYLVLCSLEFIGVHFTSFKQPQKFGKRNAMRL